jgi:hypothetical protein
MLLLPVACRNLFEPLKGASRAILTNYRTHAKEGRGHVVKTQRRDNCPIGVSGASSSYSTRKRPPAVSTVIGPARGKSGVPDSGVFISPCG